MTIFLILYAVVLTLLLTLALPRLERMTPQTRRLFAITAAAGVVVFVVVLWRILAG